MSGHYLRTICSAAVISLFVAPAFGQQKTVRQCNEEWTANKAAIQASGKTKTVFIAECRGTPATAAPGQPPPAPPSGPASGAKKTVKQCTDEWNANKPTIQASGKTRASFIAECRSGSAAIEPSPEITPPAQPRPTAVRP